MDPIHPHDIIHMRRVYWLSPFFATLLLQKSNHFKSLTMRLAVSNSHFTDILRYFSPEIIHKFIQPLKGKNLDFIL